MPISLQLNPCRQTRAAYTYDIIPLSQPVRDVTGSLSSFFFFLFLSSWPNFIFLFFYLFFLLFFFCSFFFLSSLFFLFLSSWPNSTYSLIRLQDIRDLFIVGSFIFKHVLEAADGLLTRHAQIVDNKHERPLTLCHCHGDTGRRGTDRRFTD